MSVSIFRPALLICGFSLAACGGGGGSSEEPPPSFDELLTQFQALDDQAFMFGEYNPAGFPTTGSYRYEGVMHLGTSMPQITLYGEMYMTVDFGGGDTVNGAVENIRNAANVPINGTLTMVPDQINRIQTTALNFAFEDTRLTEPGITYDLESINYNGRFRGPSGEYFYAGFIGTGDILYDDTPASINDAQRVPVSQGEIALERVN